MVPTAGIGPVYDPVDSHPTSHLIRSPVSGLEYSIDVPHVNLFGEPAGGILTIAHSLRNRFVVFKKHYLSFMPP